MQYDLTIQQHIALPHEAVADNDVSILRDDLLPFSFGGNKVRIARELVDDMRAQGKDALVMYGDRRSNLCRVLANLCFVEQIPCLMVATSEEEEGRPSFNERLVGRFDVPVVASEKSGIAAAVDSAMDLMRRDGHNPYYIYGTRLGTGNEGTIANAYAKVYRQLCSWEDAHDTHFDWIVTAYGTGGTHGGLVAGSLANGDERNVLGVSISSRPSGRALEVLKDTVLAWFAREGLDVPVDWESHILLDTDHTRGGYGRRDSRVDALIGWMLDHNSIPMDPTYTGKAFRGMLDYLSEHDIHDQRILFVHTGGLPLFFDYLHDLHQE